MKEIKAIARMTSRRNGRGKRATFTSQQRATYNMLYYLFAAVKPGSKEAPCADRVSWVGGSLDGHGIVIRKADLMAAALDCGHKHLSGRRFRHVIVSCEPCEEEEREEAERPLQESAPLFAAELGAERWIAVIQCDTNKPHMHMILANFDREKRRRLEFSPTFLKDLQELTCTPHLSSGKGARVGGHSARGKAILALKMVDPAATSRALEKVYLQMEKHKKLDLAQDDLALWLARQCAEHEWDASRLLRQDGSPRKKPVVQVDGIDLRLAFLLRFVRRRSLAPPKKSPKSPSKNRRLRRITHPDSPSGPC